MTLYYTFLRLEDKYYYPSWVTPPHFFKISPTPSINFEHSTVFQSFVLSIGGPKIRIKFSNLFGEEILKIKNAYIYRSEEDGKIDINSKIPLMFEFFYTHVIIPPKEEIFCEPIWFPIEHLSKIFISITFGDIVPKTKTNNQYLEEPSILVRDNNYYNINNKNQQKIFRHIFITEIDVYSKKPKKAIVFYGDSITRGIGIKPGELNFPEIFSKKFYKKYDFKDNYSILTQATSGLKVSIEGINYLKRDVLALRGLKYIVLNYGINDIVFKSFNAERVIKSYLKIRNEILNFNYYGIKIFISTLIPFGKCKYLYFQEKKERERKKVNEWIRSNILFDEIIDFDKAIRDQNITENNNDLNNKRDIEVIKDKYNYDFLHPNYLGYVKMAEAIDEDLFKENSI